MELRKDDKLEPLNVFCTEGRNPENFLQIILTLANHGTMIKNEVAKELGKREGDVSRRIDWLNESGFIEIAKKRIKQSKYREIHLNEYRPTLKGIFAISHLSEFNPVNLFRHHRDMIPLGDTLTDMLKEVLLSLGSDNLKLYINRIGKKVQESIDGAPLFEGIESSSPVLYWNVLMYGLPELSTAFSAQTPAKNIEETIQQIIVGYSDKLTPWIDNMVKQQEDAISSLKKLNQLLKDLKKEPTKIKELFQPTKDV